MFTYIIAVSLSGDFSDMTHVYCLSSVSAVCTCTDHTATDMYKSTMLKIWSHGPLEILRLK